MTSPAASPPPAILAGTYKPGSRPPGNLAVCIYGRSGVGKTTLIGTMPGKGLVIDVPQIEGGNFVLGAHADRIDVKDVENWNQIDEIYWFLAKSSHDYKWVAIDSITAFAELARRKTIRDRSLAEDAHTVSLQEWGKVGSLVSELIYKFRTLPMHSVWIAQERRHGSEDRGEPVSMGPDVSPRALAALQPSMLMLGRLSVEQQMDGSYERRLRVGPHPLYMSKVRAAPGVIVPSLIGHPHLGRLLRYVLGVEGAPAPEAISESIIF